MRNKRVGIITWQGIVSLNYGSALQATAMQAMLRDIGCNPVTINFLDIGKDYYSKMIELAKRGVNYTKTYIAFQKWYKTNLKLSPYMVDDNVIATYAKDQFDYLLCGSDAIWTKTVSVSRLYWDYRILDDIPHIAYSVGNESGELGYDLSAVIDKFVAISGRESIMQTLLSKYNVEVPVTLDPTLTVDVSFWDERSSKRLVKEPYILCYLISNIEYHRLSIEMIKKKYNVNKVVYINTEFIDKPYPDIHYDYQNQDYKGVVGPAEFISLIKNANVVCTDSYHGTCFSIVYGRDFFVFPKRELYNTSNQDYRFSSLLSILKLNDRYVFYNNDIDNVKIIDWNMVHNILADEKKKSKRFLADAIEKCDKGFLK